MQPEQPTSSGEQPAQDAAATSEAVSEPTQEASRSTWIQRLFRRRGAEEAESQEPTESPATSPPAPRTTEEFNRAVQAETDRREAKRLNDQRQAERRKLRDEDPFAYAENDRKAEQAALADGQVTNLFASIGAEHDKHTLDPLVMALPDAERSRIMALEGAGRGLEGRKLIVAETLKALEKQWKAEGARDAEDKLRRNSAFRKQLLNEIRRDGREPDFVSGGPPSAADQSVSNILRDQLRSRH